ncbi:polysaccharide biosynthesis C-terminal domain-containing protein [Brucella pseudogrignonensis]|uniref:Polysaccharide biosynthesis family protein n=1 Tax=Brucella pseudogrignonensis TaxID=419475 RepID=A0A256G6N5_9HYPH|nr:polysaccharide biosynthesis C-terminal domain-containing protein [Brucella pseudogrignonensis]OYR22782.1 polysaccharide biosynthesis family protein [Brucella pseudogrignonensis]
MRAIINQLGLIAQIMGGSLLALGLNLVLARSLPLAEYGAYMLAMSIASITCWGALCGYDVLASRHAQEWKDDPRMRSAFVLAGHSMIAMASLAMAAITWSVWFIFYQQVLAPEAVMLVCLITPILASTRFFAAILTGLGHPQLGHAPERFLRDGLPLIVLLIVVLFGMSLGSSVFPLVLVCLGAGAAMTATALLAQKMGYAPSADWSTAKVLRIRLQSAAFWLMLLATGQLLLSRLGLLILGYISGVDAAGLYGAVLTVSEIGGFPAVATALLYAPAIAKAYRQGESPLMILQNARRATLALTLPLVVVSVFIGGDALRIFFGEGYDAGHFALTALLLVHVVRSVALFPQLVLSLTNGEKAALYCLGVGLIIEVAFVSALIPPLGLTGAALGTLLSSMVLQCLLRRTMFRHL